MKYVLRLGLLLTLLIGGLEHYYPGAILQGLSLTGFMIVSILTLTIFSIILKVDVELNERQEVLIFWGIVIGGTILNFLNPGKDTFMSFGSLFYWIFLAIAAYKTLKIVIPGKQKHSPSE